MLREARIVMPIKVGDEPRHTNLADALVRAFGGYTQTHGNGAWFNDGKTVTDAIAIYDVAIEAERDASWDTLFQIAMAAGRELKQEAVYIRYPDGSVVIEPVHGREGLGALQPPAAPLPQKGSPPAEKPQAVPNVPLGGRRLPAVGEIWETSCGDKVAVTRKFERVHGKFDVVVLSSGPTSPFGTGLSYEVDEDGKVLMDKSSHPRDLKRFIKDF